jgi:quercetin dioxygenase-like cupin family protein
MDPRTFVPDWREVVTYAAPGPQPTLLYDEPDLRVLVAGLEPGGRIPAHPERAAVYHALEGEGTLVLDGERLSFAAGTTIIAPKGASRGIEAASRLAFLAVRVGPELDPTI